MGPLGAAVVSGKLAGALPLVPEQAVALEQALLRQASGASPEGTPPHKQQLGGRPRSARPSPSPLHSTARGELPISARAAAQPRGGESVGDDANSIGPHAEQRHTAPPSSAGRGSRAGTLGAPMSAARRPSAMRSLEGPLPLVSPVGQASSGAAPGAAGNGAVPSPPNSPGGVRFMEQQRQQAAAVSALQMARLSSEREVQDDAAQLRQLGTPTSGAGSSMRQRTLPPHEVSVPRVVIHARCVAVLSPPLLTHRPPPLLRCVHSSPRCLLSRRCAAAWPPWPAAP